MAKPKRARRDSPPAGIVPAEREQHGRVSLLAQAVLDAHGEIAQPYLAESLLRRLERAGDITDHERLAGEKFHRYFWIAHLDPLRAADVMQEIRVAGSHENHGSEDARRRITGALAALGGQGTPIGSCAWYILGSDMSMAEWARREGFGERSISARTTKQTLISALRILAVHFGT